MQKTPPVIQLPSNLKNLEVSKLVHVGHPVLKLAALSGAMATVLGAYGAHGKLLEGLQDNNFYSFPSTSSTI